MEAGKPTPRPTAVAQQTTSFEDNEAAVTLEPLNQAMPSDEESVREAAWDSWLARMEPELERLRAEREAKAKQAGE